MSGNGRSIGTAGSTHIDEILGHYSIVHEGILQDVAENEVKNLLYAVLLELRVQRINPHAQDIGVALRQEESDTITTEATYHSEDFNLQERQNADDWEILDLNWVTGEIDIRFDDDIIVAFDDPQNSNNRISYAATDDPVTGIPVSTSKVYAVAQNGTGGASLTVDAWRQGGN